MAVVVFRIVPIFEPLLELPVTPDRERREAIAEPEHLTRKLGIVTERLGRARDVREQLVDDLAVHAGSGDDGQLHAARLVDVFG